MKDKKNKEEFYTNYATLKTLKPLKCYIYGTKKPLLNKIT